MEVSVVGRVFMALRAMGTLARGQFSRFTYCGTFRVIVGERFGSATCLAYTFALSAYICVLRTIRMSLRAMGLSGVDCHGIVAPQDIFFEADDFHMVRTNAKGSAAKMIDGHVGRHFPMQFFPCPAMSHLPVSGILTEIVGKSSISIRGLVLAHPQPTVLGLVNLIPEEDRRALDGAAMQLAGSPISGVMQPAKALGPRGVLTVNDRADGHEFAPLVQLYHVPCKGTKG